jgi:hypothetical protein
VGEVGHHDGWVQTHGRGSNKAVQHVRSSELSYSIRMTMAIVILQD